MPTLLRNQEMHMELIKSMAPLIFVALVYVWFQRRKRAAYRATWVDGVPPSTQHCMTCGEDSPDAEGALRGNGWIEVLLWVCLLWPIALVYTVWRRIGKGAKRVCPECGGASLVPIGSPAARAHKRHLAH